MDGVRFIPTYSIDGLTSTDLATIRLALETRYLYWSRRKADNAEYPNIVRACDEELAHIQSVLDKISNKV